MTNKKSAHIFVFGRVQGVGFRYQTQRIARIHRISGWVRNCADGSVEALAQGDSDDIDAFIQSLKTFPPPVRVEDIKQSSITAKAYQTFSIVY